MVKPQLSNRNNDDPGTVDASSSKSKSRALLKVKPKPNLNPNPLPQLQAARPIANTPEYDSCNLRILSPDFFQIDALELAPLLLGKFLRRDDVLLQITEVEAYRPNDSACHGRFGITPRTAPVFGLGGHAYVYLCYGLHMMLNVVADKEGNGAAVLIRAAAPVAAVQLYNSLFICNNDNQGFTLTDELQLITEPSSSDNWQSCLKTIQQRRGQITEKPVLLTGPGKVGQALGLTTEWSNHPLYEPGGLELLDGPKPENILVGPRVGIEYALPEHVSAPWRFAIAGTPWISAPKNSLKPP